MCAATGPRWSTICPAISSGSGRTTACRRGSPSRSTAPSTALGELRPRTSRKEHHVPGAARRRRRLLQPGGPGRRPANQADATVSGVDARLVRRGGGPTSSSRASSERLDARASSAPRPLGSSARNRAVASRFHPGGGEGALASARFEADGLPASLRSPSSCSIATAACRPVSTTDQRRFPTDADRRPEQPEGPSPGSSGSSSTRSWRST